MPNLLDKRFIDSLHSFQKYFGNWIKRFLCVLIFWLSYASHTRLAIAFTELRIWQSVGQPLKFLLKYSTCGAWGLPKTCAYASLLIFKIITENPTNLHTNTNFTNISSYHNPIHETLCVHYVSNFQGCVEDLIPLQSMLPFLFNLHDKCIQ